jgi:hypothetical protein
MTGAAIFDGCGARTLPPFWAASGSAMILRPYRSPVSRAIVAARFPVW